MALRADGSVTVWGANADGPLNVPANLPRVVAVAAGSSRILALSEDGTVLGWGDLEAVGPDPMSTELPTGSSHERFYRVRRWQP